jgi:pimeloyl-[acyl-carrier protein] methyl ester esterase
MTLHVDAAGQGPPLVLLHGWAMHSGAWGPLPPRLARRYRVHAVDLPGHGHSAPLPAFTLDGVVAALDAALAASAQPLTVVGWSLGGLIAMRWALAKPECVTRLVLIAATPRFVASEDWPHALSARTLARFGDELRVAWKPTVQRFLALQVRGSEHGRATLALMREQLFARGEPSPGTLAGALAVLTGTDLRADLAALAQPTLVVGGSRDTLILPGAGAWLAEHLPDAKCVTISGAGHAPFLSHPEAFAAAVEAFLDGR